MTDELNDFQQDVIAELAREGVVDPHCVGKTRFRRCFWHRRKLDRFEGKGKQASSVHALACERCRMATVEEFFHNWTGYEPLPPKRLIRIPERVPWKAVPANSD